MRNIYGLGETVYDIIFRDGQPQRAVAGGSTFNTLVSLGRCRLQPTMVTEIGDDYVGEIIKQFMHGNGVNTDFVTINRGKKTPVSLAFLDERNDAHYQFYKDTAASLDQRDFPEFTADDIVIFGSFYAVNPALRLYTREFIRRAKEAGAVLYYDVNLRPAHKGDLPQVLASIEENMQMATIVRASHEDIECVYGVSIPRVSNNSNPISTTNKPDAEHNIQAIERMRSLCKNLILTHGADGVEFFSPTLSRRFPTAPIATVSTIGAGDNFNAGIVHSLLTEGWTYADLIAPTADMLSTMNDRAQRFAANVCQSLTNYVSTTFADEISAN